MKSPTSKHSKNKQTNKQTKKQTDKTKQNKKNNNNKCFVLLVCCCCSFSTVSECKYGGLLGRPRYVARERV